jgi:1-acyl-sn-glycerol-3-phosphate acyltransferase
MKFWKPRGLRPPAWVYTRVLRWPLRALARYKIFSVEVINREVVPMKGAVIVACNHISMSDPVFLWGAMRRNAVALAMKELWRWPFVGQVVWLLGHIPVDRGNRKAGERVLKRVVRYLRRKALILWFPEGSCSKDGVLRKPKPGIARASKMTGTPIIPVGIKGSNDVWPLGSKRINRRAHVVLKFGDPIYPDHFQGPGAEQDILDELYRRILALST